MEYKLLYNKDNNGNVMSKAILDTNRGCYIPEDQRNYDYQAYLKWLDAGNIPEVIE